jgi:hypothetical protein
VQDFALGEAALGDMVEVLGTGTAGISITATATGRRGAASRSTNVIQLQTSAIGKLGVGGQGSALINSDHHGQGARGLMGQGPSQTATINAFGYGSITGSIYADTGSCQITFFTEALGPRVGRAAFGEGFCKMELLCTAARFGQHALSASYITPGRGRSSNSAGASRTFRVGRERRAQ